jgi:hypothetical protein
MNSSFNINLNKEKRVEKEIGVPIGFKGEWNIEFINPDRGTSSFPFGHEMKKNMILQNFYDVFVNLLHENEPSLAALIANSSAHIGNGSGILNTNNSSLSSLVATSNLTTPDDSNCFVATEYDYINGSCSFIRFFDFQPSLTENREISEAGISNPYVYNAIFSRFILPRKVIWPIGAMLRLKYKLTCQIKCLVDPIPINLSTGGFVGDGFLKLCGLFSDIFGEIDDEGYLTRSGTLHLPIIKTYWTDQSYYIATSAFMIKGLLNFPISNELLGTFTLSSGSKIPFWWSNNYYSFDQTLGFGLCGSGGKYGFSSVLNYNQSQPNERSCRYFFSGLNPLISSKKWGGIIFSRSGVHTRNNWPDNLPFVTKSSPFKMHYKTSRPQNSDGIYYKAACFYWKFNNEQIRYTDQTVDVILTQFLDNSRQIELDDQNILYIPSGDSPIKIY